MRFTQLLEGEGATELVALLVGFAVEEGDRDVVDVDALLGIRDVEVAGALVEVGDAVLPLPCVLPSEEQPARANPVTTQTLAARTNWREAGTDRR